MKVIEFDFLLATTLLLAFGLILLATPAKEVTGKANSALNSVELLVKEQTN